MAGEIIKDDLYKFLVAFAFSTSPAIVQYTTWTIATRNLVLILAPFFVYLLFKCKTSLKYIPLTFIIALLLLASHHLFYFMIPIIFGFLILIIIFKFKNYKRFLKIPDNIISYISPLILITGFLLMFSITFLGGRFVEYSRYSIAEVTYVRYIGIMAIPAIGGLGYLILKPNKTFGLYFLILSLMIITVFINQVTYIKWFIMIFIIPVAAIGLLNIIQLSKKIKYAYIVASFFLILSIVFISYYQFLHVYDEDPYNKRFIEDSTYKTGRWMKENVNGSATSNDRVFSIRVFSASETAHFFTPFTITNQIYNFSLINISNYKRYPLTSEDFWLSGYSGPDVGESEWDCVDRTLYSPARFNITYVVENRKTKGNTLWHHGIYPSKLLQFSYENEKVFDNGNINIWYLY